MPALDQISLSGFKSIRELPDFKLGHLNVLVGPNGAGKSNLVDFFRMLRAMADGGFQRFITNQGGADGFFFGGPKETKEIGARLVFGLNEFRFTLEATVASEMTIKEEATRFRGGEPGWYRDWYPSNWHSHGVGKKESSLPTWKDGRSPDGKRTIDSYVYEAVASWTVYHFHDTSSSAPMRRPWPARDFRELLPDAGNIAPFLLRMRETSAASYQRIRETVQLMAPFFDDFLLEPETKGDAELVRLEWRQRGSRFAFQPYQFSDGTIRFICLATALLQPSPPSTVVIDEPELGLHPVALATLAALLHERAGRTQLLVSTQSPALLDHFEPEHVVVVERAEGASVFKRLEPAVLEHRLAKIESLAPRFPELLSAMRNAFAQQLTELARQDERLVLLSGDIGNRLFDRLKADCPGRFLNCGVAEGNMIGVATGLALAGLRPVCYTIAPFLTYRCLEQIRVDLCYHHVPVTLVGTGAGLAYASLGATHHSCEEMGMLRLLPGLAVVAPGDPWEVRAALRAAVQHPGPVYLRIGKKGEPPVHAAEPAFAIGRALRLREGTDVCFLNAGTLLPVALQAAEALSADGLGAGVYSFHTLKPLDETVLATEFARCRLVVTLEEHSVLGGLGGSVAEWLADQPRASVRARLMRCGTRDEFLHLTCERESARSHFGLTSEAIAARVRQALSA